MRIQVIAEELFVGGVPVLQVVPGAPNHVVDALREVLGSVEFDRLVHRYVAEASRNRLLVR